MFTRVTVDHIYNLGRTFRLLLDGFGNKMPPDVSSFGHLSLCLANVAGDYPTRSAREWPDPDLRS